MQIEEIHFIHWKLRNPAQIHNMVQSIVEGECLPPIKLLELPDGTIQLQDGHHRCIAYYLSGRTYLKWGEYILYPVDKAHQTYRGKVSELANYWYQRLYGIS